MLSNREIAELYTIKKMKRITNKKISQELNLAEGTISRFFNMKQVLSQERERQINNFILNYKYKTACERCGQ